MSVTLSPLPAKFGVEWGVVAIKDMMNNESSAFGRWRLSKLMLRFLVLCLCLILHVIVTSLFVVQSLIVVLNFLLLSLCLFHLLLLSSFTLN